MRSFAAMIMRSRSHALGTASFLALLSLLFPPIGYLAGATIALVTLRHGGNDGAKVLLSALLIVLGLEWVASGGIASAIVMALLWLPVFGLALMLRSTRSLLLVLYTAAMLGVVLLLFFYWMADGSPTQLWQEWASQILAPPPGQQPVNPQNGIMLFQLDSQTAEMLAGLLASSYFLGLLVTVLVARGWQAMLYNPDGLKEEFLALRSEKSVALLGLVIILAGLLMESIPPLATDLVQVWTTLFMVIGLAVSHALADMRGLTKGWVIALYVLSLFTPLGMMMTMIGATDAWANYRQYFEKS